MSEREWGSPRGMASFLAQSADVLEMKGPESTSPGVRQRSSIESFLDEYQLVRLSLNAAGVIMVIVLGLGGWWGRGSPVFQLLVPLSIASHAAWCHFRGTRAPRTMLVMDTTLLGAVMFTIADYPAVTAAVFGFLVVLVVLFAEGRWMVGLLAYATVWYVAAFLNEPSVHPTGSLVGTLFTVMAVAVVMIRVRSWLGRLDANRSQMLGTVSHELRNNLTRVLGLTEVVSTMADLEPEEAAELIAIAHQQALDATEIVEDLMTASRMERATLTLVTGLVDVNAEVVTTARRFQGAGTDIDLMLADDLPPAWADPLRVRQALRNLLSNAIRYGGPDITIATRRAGAAIEITVRDNGDGVPQEDEYTIFLPYRRSTQGRRDSSSIGLGLWICRQLAQAMEGSLDYQRCGDFTEFILTVPVARPDQEPASAADLPSPKRTAADESHGIASLGRHHPAAT